jgi:glycopeptide antibiotics resistance protein
MRSSLKNEIILLITVSYIAAVIKITIVPDVTLMWIPEEERFLFQIKAGSPRMPNLIPFQTIFGFIHGETYVNETDSLRVILKNLFGNLFLLTPLGFLLPTISARFRKASNVFAFGIVFAILIEVIQYFIGRVSDIDDVILNSIGILLGYLFYWFFAKYIPGLLSKYFDKDNKEV